TRISTCNRHPNDAAVPASCLKRLGEQTYAKTYAQTFQDRPLTTHFSPSTRRNLNGSFQGTPASRSTKQNSCGGFALLLSFEAYRPALDE
ncbi:hypothetical protein, partial [Burkholderia sp. SIMBA_052]|uniref:hypothetical protein n=1 Tax=Burkholderia sp. SIMBA_052 TaxID=3085793 RepID=UPI00397C8915